ncbi:MAG TPA: hypothetical protein VM598_03015 [Bdellovibrionota bacterium]|nr:hypothetical protein [Bdellovibrionota bacterium]
MKRRKTDRREAAQFIWTFLVGLAVVVAALHDTRSVTQNAPGRAPGSEIPAPTPTATELLRAR